MAAVPLCLGNYPQLVRLLSPFLQAERLSGLRPGRPRPPSPEWRLETLGPAATGDIARDILALGLLRLAGHFDRADAVLASLETAARPSLRGALVNERGAIAWHRGRADEALNLWEELGQTMPGLFNRGMAALFADRATEARPLLVQAVTHLPEDGPWHSLGRLYLALAEIRA